jgi:glucose/arabinose dehydrogenase/PKD repeat protein
MSTRVGRGHWFAGLLVTAGALMGPTVASSSAAEYKVLVVRSTDDAVSQAGTAAIRSAARAGKFTVVAPSPADVGDQFTVTKLQQYRAVVFLDTGLASPLTDAQRARFEDYFHAGGGFVGIGSAIEETASWDFLKQLIGTTPSSRTAVQTGTVKVFDRVHDASKSLPMYWDRTDAFYNFATNPGAFNNPTANGGQSHVLASVVEDPFEEQPQGNTLTGISGGTMGAQHPVSFCKDYLGGRSFYTALGNTPESFDATMTTHLRGAINWAAGQSDPTYSDCGATVLRNYQQVKISGNAPAPGQLNEPIGFDQLPDGRIIQTARRGEVRLHNPADGSTRIIADLGSAALPQTLRVYTNSEDGLYGPAVDPNFAQNHWVYLYYAPQTVQDVKLSTGAVVTQTTPNDTVPNFASSPAAWDPFVGYFQLSRFKFVEDANGPRLDLSSEQQILRVSNNRQECCHVAGDIDFDKAGNLWMVTGDDTPAGGIRANGYGPFEDELTDEQQTVRTTNATGGTFTLTFNGQTTAPLPFNATAAQVNSALGALPNIGADNIQTSGGPANTANVNVFFRRALKGANQNQITADGSALTGTAPTVTATTPAVNNGTSGGVTRTTPTDGGMYQRPTGDDRRSTLNTNDLRGKILRIKVKDNITAADANKADLGSGTGAYTVPSGNLRDYSRTHYPSIVTPDFDAKFRPEIYAMGFRNPFRLQVDENDVAYVTDYSPDAQTPQRSRGPAGVGRMEVVRRPENYGYPVCYSSKLGYFRWNFQEFADGTTTVGRPLDNPPQAVDCGNPNSLVNDSRWVRDGGPGFAPGLAAVPPVSNPDVWYSYRDNNAATPLGTPCFGQYATTPGPVAPGSTTECPRLFPELFTGGVGPHGAAKYHYDPSNPSKTKFPPYYDNSVILGEFTQDTMREVKYDGQNRIQKINPFLDCGAANVATSPFDFECDNPMDMQFGPDGSFYLLTYGDGFFAINADAGMYRWDYVKGRQAPKAVIKTDRTDGALPLTVHFDGTGSSDRDPGDSIRFEWDFGDGSPTSTDVSPTHVFTKGGRFQVVLTVFDSSGEKGTASVPITAGNTSPTVVINTPVAGGTFAFGDKIPYSVTVTDPEDGVVNCADVQVTFVLGHDTHGHAEASTTGCSGSLPTDATDVAHGGNVFGVIDVKYLDKGGPGNVPSLEGTGQAQIRQKHQEVEFVVNQSGTNTGTNNDSGLPGVHRGSLADGDWIQLNGPFNLTNIDSITFRVADAAAGRTAGSPLAAIELRKGSPTGEIVSTHNLVSTGGTATWTSQTFPISLAGTNDLFLVFRAVTGGQTGNNLFNLNWVEFNGAGVGT